MEKHGEKTVLEKLPTVEDPKHHPDAAHLHKAADELHDAASEARSLAGKAHEAGFNLPNAIKNLEAMIQAILAALGKK